MAEAITLTDATLNDTLRGEKPVVLLFTNGDGLRGDFTTAFKKAAGEHDDIVFARIDPSQNPQAAERFQVGSKPLLIGMRGEEVISRRNRPWGTDVASVIEALQQSAPEPVHETAVDDNATNEAVDSSDSQSVSQTTQKEPNPMTDNKPVNVTDANFQQEVIDYHLPVVVDFWAEWCGPCRMVAPVLDKLAEEFAGKVRVAKVNVDENPGLSQAFQIMSIPTLMMLKEQNIVFSQPGALPEPALRDLFNQLVELEIPKEEEGEGEAETEASGESAD